MKHRLLIALLVGSVHLFISAESEENTALQPVSLASMRRKGPSYLQHKPVLKQARKECPLGGCSVKDLPAKNVPWEMKPVTGTPTGPHAPKKQLMKLTRGKTDVTSPTRHLLYRSSESVTK